MSTVTMDGQRGRAGPMTTCTTRILGVLAFGVAALLGLAVWAWDIGGYRPTWQNALPGSQTQACTGAPRECATRIADGLERRLGALRSQMSTIEGGVRALSAQVDTLGERLRGNTLLLEKGREVFQAARPAGAPINFMGRLFENETALKHQLAHWHAEGVQLHEMHSQAQEQLRAAVAERSAAALAIARAQGTLDALPGRLAMLTSGAESRRVLEDVEAISAVLRDTTASVSQTRTILGTDEMLRAIERLSKENVGQGGFEAWLTQRPEASR